MWSDEKNPEIRDSVRITTSSHPRDADGQKTFCPEKGWHKIGVFIAAGYKNYRDATLAVGSYGIHRRSESSACKKIARQHDPGRGDVSV